MVNELHGNILAISQNLCGSLSPASAGFNGTLSAGYTLQDKVIVPSADEQIVTADVGFGGLASVTIAPVPQNYGLITYDGTTITVS